MATGEQLAYPPVARSPEIYQGQSRGVPGPSGEVGVIIDNRSGLPDTAVREAVRDQWIELSETAGLQFAQPTSFQLYSNNSGSMLARTPWRTPRNIIEEIKLARSVADMDDDVAATLDFLVATAFGLGVENHHRDEDTLEWFNEIAKPVNMNLVSILKEMYREYLIAGGVTTLSLFMRRRLSYYKSGSTTPENAQLAIPAVGVLPAEDLRVITNDVVGSGQLGYVPPNDQLKRWLNEYWSPRTSPAKRNQMAADEPVAAALFTGKQQISWDDGDPLATGLDVFTLNQRMVHRTTMPKGAAPYPRPPLARNFALLEAKRLLNIMDYALLQGGTNYIVVARKGTDQMPAQQPEVDNLVEQVRAASRSGVLVGDHRLSFEIITPKLDEMLNPGKRKLLGRKISMALLRIPEQVTNDAGAAGAQQEMEYAGIVVTSDRTDMLAHAESTFYEEIANRNRATFTQGPPSIWCPKIVLAGNKDFFAAVLQARDRGDIPRRWAVETLGFDWAAGVAERQREIARGEDDIMIPATVPFSPTPGGKGPPGERDPYGPSQQGGSGRPPGSSPNNGRGQDSPHYPAVPNGGPPRRGGEPVRAWMEDGEFVRMGEITAAIIEEYPDAEIGRVTATERQAIDERIIFQQGPVAVIPVNVSFAVRDIRSLRLAEGVSMVLGVREGDGAIVAKALCFREPHFDISDAEERAVRWGYEVAAREKMKKCKHCGNEIPSYSLLCPNCGNDPDHDDDVDPPGADSDSNVATIVATAIAEAIKNLPQPTVLLQLPGEGPRRVVRDEHGEITGTEPINE